MPEPSDGHCRRNVIRGVERDHDVSESLYSRHSDDTLTRTCLRTCVLLLSKLSTVLKVEVTLDDDGGRPQIAPSNLLPTGEFASVINDFLDPSSRQRPAALDRLLVEIGDRP